MVDTLVSEASGLSLWGFKSPPSHQRILILCSVLGTFSSAAHAKTLRYELSDFTPKTFRIVADFSEVTRIVINPSPSIQPFISDLSLQTEAPKAFPLKANQPIDLRVCKKQCRLSYVFHYRDAAEKIDDIDRIGLQDSLVIGDPSLWLFAGDSDAADAPDLATLSADTATSSHMAHGFFPAGPSYWSWNPRHKDGLAPMLIGDIQRETLQVGASAIEIVRAKSALPINEKSVLAWIKNASSSVAQYIGRFPVPKVLLYLRPVKGGGEIRGGKTFGSGGATILIPVPTESDDASLKRDWVLTHEFMHLSLPLLPRQHHWMEEGLATYAEPVARYRLGFLTRAQVFGDMMQGMPSGQPEADDRGLDHTPTWGRTYWGGAFYYLHVDIELRKRSQGKIGVENGLQGIAAAGGSIAELWDVEHVLKAADKGTGFTVFSDTYAKMKDKMPAEDLDRLWKDLGISADAKVLHFAEKGEMARVRESLLSGKP